MALDVIIVGGGIVGLATAHRLLESNPSLKIALFEKEAIKSYKIATIEKGIFISDWIKTIIPICLAIQSNTLDTSSYPILPNNTKSVFVPSFAKGNTLDCHVLYIDTFGNIIINFTKKEWEENWNKRNFNLSFSRTSEIHEISTDYHSHEPGSKICRFNEAGFLEIAIFKSNPSKFGSANSLLGLNYRDLITIKFV